MGGKNIVDIIRNAQYRVFYEDLEEHKDDILLYYAYNYMHKKAIDLDEEKLKKIENFVTTFATFYALEGIESYCDHLSVKNS